MKTPLTKYHARQILRMAETCYSEGQGPESFSVLDWVLDQFPGLRSEFDHVPIHYSALDAIYDPAPVLGYGLGRMISPSAESPHHWPAGVAPRFDENGDIWFLLRECPEGYLGWREEGPYLVNVHPYREDLEGYPVRWLDSVERLSKFPPHPGIGLWILEINDLMR